MSPKLREYHGITLFMYGNDHQQKGHQHIHAFYDGKKYDMRVYFRMDRNTKYEIEDEMEENKDKEFKKTFPVAQMHDLKDLLEFSIESVYKDYCDYHAGLPIKGKILHVIPKRKKK